MNNKNKYSFLDKNIAQLELEEFLESQEKYNAFYAPMRKDIMRIIESNPQVQIGVYFEDLSSRAWVGINEREKFIPASLLKTTAVAAALKMTEEGSISLSDKIIIEDDDLNERFGELYQHKGEIYSLVDLIEIGLTESDNTAIEAVRGKIPPEKIAEARLAMGLPITSVTTNQIGTPLSPKEYSSIFKSLYLSGYLSRGSSNYILSLLEQTDLSYGLKEGVSPETKVAHKIGAYQKEGSMHDCGIVYAKNPYILCIMTKNQKNLEESKVIITEISSTVYNFVSSN